MLRRDGEVCRCQLLEVRLRWLRQRLHHRASESCNGRSGDSSCGSKSSQPTEAAADQAAELAAKEAADAAAKEAADKPLLSKLPLIWRKKTPPAKPLLIPLPDPLRRTAADVQSLTPEKLFHFPAMADEGIRPLGGKRAEALGRAAGFAHKPTGEIPCV
jgi:hypothetical protein